MPHRSVPPANRRFGKAMRQRMTEAEVRLWLHLRKPGIEGLRFRRQALVGPYIVDLFCPQHRLIVEVDGGQHADDVVRDRERDAWLAEQGYRVVRVWNNDVMENVEGVCEAIAVAAHEAPPLTPSRNR
jgi:very-short-patch-repair endonuclease